MHDLVQGNVLLTCTKLLGLTNSRFSRADHCIFYFHRRNIWGSSPKICGTGFTSSGSKKSSYSVESVAPEQQGASHPHTFNK